ncbi:MAG: UvrB/UvrC motif-containing protein, partial [Gemmatimonadales bacterium]
VPGENREEVIALLQAQMQQAAEDLDFELAALLRDQIFDLRAEGDPTRRAPQRGRPQRVR